MIKFHMQCFACIVLITAVVCNTEMFVVTVIHRHVCKDGDTHVGAEDADDAEEMDIGIYFCRSVNR